MKVFGVTIETAEIEVDPVEYTDAKADGELADLLDTRLSDMDGNTVVVERDGTVIDPYGVLGGRSLLELLHPILRHVDPWSLAHYCVMRQTEAATDHAIKYEREQKVKDAVLVASMRNEVEAEVRASMNKEGRA